MSLKKADNDDSNSSTSRVEELRLTLGEHLEELRGRIIRSLIYVAVGAVGGAFLAKPFYGLIQWWVLEPMEKDYDMTIIMGVTDGFGFWVRLAVTIGLVFALPLIVREIWGFIKPGLKPNEAKPIETVVPISMGLFFLGCFLCWLILPPTMGWFIGITAQFDNVEIFQQAPEIVYFCSKMMLAFGIGFQLPLIVFFLAKVGIVSPEMIWRYWRQVTVGVFVLSAVLTPSGDPFSMMVMALPLTGLFFASIQAAKMTTKKSGVVKKDEEDVLNNLD